MPLSKEEAFHLEEFKALRHDISTTLKDRLEFNRWGLIAVAALYAYIASHPAPLLFTVPPLFSLIVCVHLRREHKTVVDAAGYITDLERFAAAPVPGGPGGWEHYLTRILGALDKRQFDQWWPLPLWYVMFVGTLLIACLAWAKLPLFS
jgi:hypothetical protein